MVLKPFMLRRVKRDVECELGEKIEVQVDCALAPRQRGMYAALKSKVGEALPPVVWISRRLRHCRRTWWAA